MRHIEISEGGAQWAAHGNSVALNKGSVFELEGGLLGTDGKEGAEFFFLQRRRRKIRVVIGSLDYNIDCFIDWNIVKRDSTSNDTNSSPGASLRSFVWSRSSSVDLSM